MPAKAVIYFLGALSGEGRIKIGATSILESRFKHFQLHSPVDIEILASFDADYGVEKDLHYMFRNCSVGREWFSRSPDLLEFIRSIKEGATPQVPKRDPGFTSYHYGWDRTKPPGGYSRYRSWRRKMRTVEKAGNFQRPASLRAELAKLLDDDTCAEGEKACGEYLSLILGKLQSMGIASPIGRKPNKPE